MVGAETVRLNGKQIGCQKNSIVVTPKSIETKEVIRKLSKEFGSNISDTVRSTGLPRNTYYVTVKPWIAEKPRV